ncbi:MAG: dihydrofolate reductase family protein [bacterium]|nr:dihydrofolate reductase family protein [bacterium]
MNIIMVMVMSVDGRITKGRDTEIYSWTSEEDKIFFSTIMKENNLVIMGSKTYASIKKNIKPSAAKLRVIMTREPKKYSLEAVPGKIEFSDEPPEQLMQKLQDRGYDKLLLLGGAEINRLFLKANLVNELILTLEPRIFGTGKLLTVDELLDKELRLTEVRTLNNLGTLLLRYHVDKQ